MSSPPTLCRACEFNEGHPCSRASYEAGVGPCRGRLRDYEAGRAAERADAVAWLRSELECLVDGDSEYGAYAVIHNAMKQGAHIGAANEGAEGAREDEHGR